VKWEVSRRSAVFPEGRNPPGALVIAHAAAAQWASCRSTLQIVHGPRRSVPTHPRTSPGNARRSFIAPAPAVALVASVPILAWAAIGRHDVDDAYSFGPYDIGLPLEIGALIIAAAAFSTSLITIARRRGTNSASGVSIRAARLLVLAGCFCAWAWRNMTKGVSANIGAGLLAFGGPPIVSALVCGAVLKQHRDRPMSRARYLALLAAAVALAPALYALLAAL
jgi:hypothetical protein